jgi:hypothetical protein
MKTAIAIRNNTVIVLNFFEPVDGFIAYPDEDQQGNE